MELSTNVILWDMGVPYLRSLATDLGLPKSITRKAELIQALADHLDNNLESILKQLTAQERNLVAEAAYSKGPYDRNVFLAKYPEWMPQRPLYCYGRPEYTSLTWLFLQFSEDQFTMPPKLAARVKKLVRQPARAEARVQQEIPTEIPDKEFGTRIVQVHNAGEIAPVELNAILALVDSGKVAVTAKSRRPTSTAEKRVKPVLVSGDFELEIPAEHARDYSHGESAGAVRAHAWPVLIQQCGWAKPRGDKLVLTQAGVTVMTRGRAEDIRAGVRKFILDDQFDELHRVNHIRGQTGRAKRYMSRPSLRKSEIWASMAEWPLEEWISFNDAYRFTGASGHTFWSCRQPLYLYIGSFEYGHLSDGRGVDRQYLRAFLFESLGTLGLIDVAYVFPHYLWPEFRAYRGSDDSSFTSRYDGLLCVRLNRLGAYCLGLTEEYQAAPVQKGGIFRVLPNFEVAVIHQETLPPAITHMLDTIAERASDFIWKIDRDGILHYLESGGRPKQVVEFLRDHSSEGIPDNVRTFLDDLGRRAKGVRSSEDALLIEMEQESAAAEIAADARTAKYCMRANGSLLVVRKRNVKAFQGALKKLGYVLPR